MGGLFQPIFFARSTLVVWRRSPADGLFTHRTTGLGGAPGGMARGRDFCVVTKARVGKVLSDSGFGSKAQGAGRTPAAGNSPVADALAAPARMGWQDAIGSTVAGLGYELVDVERAQRGLLRITIDRIPGGVYRTSRGPDAVVDSNQFVTVEDCEQVTRQLQYALEVEGLDYARLEVSSPGLDRPLKREADYQRFTGLQISITLKQPFEKRKNWQGVLTAGESGAWSLVFKVGKTEQVLGFTLQEVREARLVPVVNFKGRQSKLGNDADTGGSDQAAARAAGADKAAANPAPEVDGG